MKKKKWEKRENSKFGCCLGDIVEKVSVMHQIVFFICDVECNNIYNTHTKSVRW